MLPAAAVRDGAPPFPVPAAAAVAPAAPAEIAEAREIGDGGRGSAGRGIRLGSAGIPASSGAPGSAGRPGGVGSRAGRGFQVGLACGVPDPLNPGAIGWPGTPGNVPEEPMGGVAGLPVDKALGVDERGGPESDALSSSMRFMSESMALDWARALASTRDKEEDSAMLTIHPGLAEADGCGCDLREGRCRGSDGVGRFWKDSEVQQGPQKRPVRDQQENRVPE